MTNIEIINKIMDGGAFNYNGYRYWMDMASDGEWVIFRAKLRSWGYSTKEAKVVCSFSF